MYEIHDDTGLLFSGDRDKIQLIWDYTTRTPEDLAGEYKITLDESNARQAKHALLEWKGRLLMKEIIEMF